MVPLWHRYRSAGLVLLCAGGTLVAQPAIGPVEGPANVRIIAPIQYTLPAVGGLPDVSPVRTRIGVPQPPAVSFGLSEPVVRPFRPDAPPVSMMPISGSPGSGPHRPSFAPPAVPGDRVLPTTVVRPSSPGMKNVFFPESGVPVPSPLPGSIAPTSAVPDVPNPIDPASVHTWMLPPKPQPRTLIDSLPPPSTRREPAPVQRSPSLLPEILPPTQLLPVARGSMPLLRIDGGGIDKPTPDGTVVPASFKTNAPQDKGPPMLELLSPTRLRLPPEFGNAAPASGVPPRTSRDVPKVLPINLATALTLAGVRPIDVQVAARQTELAAATYLRAKAQWAPSISIGGDFFRHEGAFQNFSGAILEASRNSAMGGVGLNAVFSVSDAVFGPLAARREVQARQAFQQATGNDVALRVTDSYFQIQQARADYLVAEELASRGIEVVRRIEALAEGLAPPSEASRARVELSRRRQAAIAAMERWQNASADLNRSLRLEPGILLETAELPGMTVRVFAESGSVDDLIVSGLRNRPELEGHRAVVEATVERLRQEKLRPLLPSILLRSASTNPSGSLAYGAFGGGQGGRTGDFKARFDYDAQIVWELQNLGLGNRARIRERQAERELAALELFRVQDLVAAEVAQSHARLKSATDRLQLSESAVRDAMETFDSSLEGMRQTRRAGNLLALVVRPSETIAALQGLAQTTVEYQQTVADFNRAQFGLWRAIGNPSQNLLAELRGVGESSLPDGAACAAKPVALE